MKSYSGAEINRFEMTKGFGLNCVRFSSTSQYLIGGSGDNTIRIFDLKTRSLVSSISQHSSEVFSVSVNKDDSLIASSSLNGEIYTHNLSDTS